MFLDADERLLPLQFRVDPSNLETLKRFRDIGVKTMQLNAHVSWHYSEPEPGTYNFDDSDEAVALLREAGLKVIVHLYWRAPDWLPNEGKIEIISSPGTPNVPQPDRVFAGTTTWLAVNPFHEESFQAELRFLEQACEHFTAPGVQCTYAMPYSAERMLPFNLGPCYTEQMCIDVVLARQEIFAKYSDMLWSAFHPILGMGASSVDGSTPPNVGNEHSPAVYAAMAERFPGHLLNRNLYGWFGVPGIWKDHLPGVKTWVGSEYAQGIVKHTRMLNDERVWGMLMSCPPRFRNDPPRQPTEEEFGNIAEAIKILNDGLDRAEEIYMSDRLIHTS